KKRVEITNLFVDWMKKSYTPVAGLGTVTRINNKVSLGVKFLVWDVSHDKMWTDEKGHFKPIDEQNTSFGIWCNTVPGSHSIPFLNYGGDNYFTWPTDGYGAIGKDLKELDLAKFSAINKYITRNCESQVVLLAPGNKLPFEQITKGEYLNAALENIDKELQKRKDDILDQNRGDDKATVDRRESFYAFKEKEFDRFRTGVKKYLDTYKDRLNEPALIRDLQPTINNFYGDMDPFKKDISGSLFPVYKISKDVLEKCKTEKPQWIAVWFYYETKENGNKLFELYRSMTENLNYEYIYNYFFSPEKVKGVSYTPANADGLKARLDAYRKKNTVAIGSGANTTAHQGDAWFADNFSASNEGGEPANWFFRRYGKHPIVTAIKNQDGKWLQLGYGVPVSPTLLKKPLPENFTLEYDLATDGDFSSRTGGAAVLALNTRKQIADGTEALGGDGSRLSIEIASGNEADYDNNNYRGILTIKINSTPSANKQNGQDGISYEYPLREFTNKKTSVHVTVKVKAGIVTILVNDKQVAVSTNFKMGYGDKCVTCGVGTATFDFVDWENTTNDADNVKVYISNIKITKE
ncbi:MAG: hypothetical protein ABIU77_18485, partial [Ferruginibacter sp.]